jgi:NHL repeat
MCVRPAIFSLGFALAAGCAGVPRASVPGPVWPPPPAAPRVSHFGSAERPSDLGARRPFSARVLNTLTGGDRGDEAWILPGGLAVDERGDLCLTDTGSPMVGWYEREARRFHRWTRIGRTDLVLPVAVAKRGELLAVADTGLGRVIVFGTDGRPRFELGPPLQRPAAVAFHGEHLLVVDSATHRVHAYSLTGGPLAETGGRGEGPGQFNYPTHLAADAAGDVWITDSLNFRVQRLDGALAPVSSFGRQGTGGGHFARPKGVAVAPGRIVLVVDALFDNVQVFDAAGRFLLHFGDHGAGPGQFCLPSGIAAAADGTVYVADTRNHRVQIFRLQGEP